MSGVRQDELIRIGSMSCLTGADLRIYHAACFFIFVRPPPNNSTHAFDGYVYALFTVGPSILLNSLDDRTFVLPVGYPFLHNITDVSRGCGVFTGIGLSFQPFASASWYRVTMYDALPNSSTLHVITLSNISILDRARTGTSGT